MTAGYEPRPSRFLDAATGAARKITESRRYREPLDHVACRAAARLPRGELFRTRISRAGAVNVIAECKRRSPSRGLLVQAYDPAVLAGTYETGGAAAVSVLTEPSFFDGSIDDLERVRATTSLPVLRKDFIVDEYQLYEARAAGADAVLLIVAALGAAGLKGLIERARGLGLGALVEIHDTGELAVATEAGASIIGVNSRDLVTLEVDERICEELVARIPPGVVTVAESGLRSIEAVHRMRDAGYSAVLVGEWLATSPDPVRVLQAIAGGRGGEVLGG